MSRTALCVSLCLGVIVVAATRRVLPSPQAYEVSPGTVTVSSASQASVPGRAAERRLPLPDVAPTAFIFGCRADLRRTLSRARTPEEQVRFVLRMPRLETSLVGERYAELVRAAKDSFVAVVESDPEKWLPVLWRHGLPVRELGAAIAPALARALASDDERLHPMAVEMLADLGSDAEAARPAVQAVMAKGDWWVGYAARQALVAMGDGPAKHVEVLVAGLRAASSEQREWAARYLGNIGRGAQDAIPALAQALDGESSVAAAAAEAISRIGVRPDTAVPALLGLLGRDLAGDPRATTLKCGAATALAVFTGTDDRATDFVRETLSPGSPSPWASCVAIAAARLAPRNDDLAQLVSQAADEQVFPVDDLLLELSIEQSPGPGFIELAREAALYGDHTSARWAVEYLGTLARGSESCGEAMSVILALASSRGSPGRLAAVDAISPGVTCMQGEAAEVLAGILAEDAHTLDDEGRYIIVRHALCSLADLGPAASRAEREVRELKARYPGSKAREIDEATGIVSLPELADAALAAMQPARPVDEVE
jgi:hypothetical protein